MLLSPYSFAADRAFSGRSSNIFYEFDCDSMLLIFFIGCMTVFGNFCVNKTLFYEKAGRATAYYNLELLYTFIFDIVVMKD